MAGWMDEWMDGWMDEWMDEWMDGWSSHTHITPADHSYEKHLLRDCVLQSRSRCFSYEGPPSPFLASLAFEIVGFGFD